MLKFKLWDYPASYLGHRGDPEFYSRLRVGINSGKIFTPGISLNICLK